MMTVAENNLIIIAVALLIGIAVAFWMFRGRSAAPQAPRLQADEAPRRTFTPVSQTRAASAEGAEGNSVIDEGAKAPADVAAEILDAPVHDALPGADAPDNLQLLKGVGPRLAATLNQNGITRFEHLAALDSDALAELDAKLGTFKGRLARDRVVDQASYLARGDRDGFAAQFGNLSGS